jgi:hypothetical protein
VGYRVDRRLRDFAEYLKEFPEAGPEAARKDGAKPRQRKRPSSPSESFPHGG